MNTFLAGEKVRLNTPNEADHDTVVTVLGSSISPVTGHIDYWIQMPSGHAWLYRPHELAETENDHIRYIIAVGGGFAVGVVYTTREKAEAAAKNYRLKYYEVIPQRVTKNA